MTEEAAKQNKKQPSRDRVTLDPVAVIRLDSWLNEIQSHLKGVRVSRSDLVNFLISQHPAALNSREIELLKETHFDEAAFAEWALKEFRKAKDKGENPSLADILKPIYPIASPRPRSAKKPEKAHPQGEAAVHLPNPVPRS